jgi:hypothetical protein
VVRRITRQCRIMPVWIVRQLALSMQTHFRAWRVRIHHVWQHRCGKIFGLPAVDGMACVSLKPCQRESSGRITTSMRKSTRAAVPLNTYRAMSR